MTARLTTTTTYSDGHVDAWSCTWDGWDVDDAAAHHRGRRGAPGAHGRHYAGRLGAGDATVASIRHDWDDTDQMTITMKETR